MFFRYFLLTTTISLLLIGCGNKSYTSKTSQPPLPGINLEDSEISSEIRIIDEEGAVEQPEHLRSSFFILNPQVQGWRTYYYVENIFQQFPDVAPETEKEIPIVLNDRVMHYMDYFQSRGRRSFSIWLARSGKYIPAMKAILEERGMPSDLVYLAMIESGFNVKARSHAAAVGPWQFIKPTAKRYGLRVDQWVDERMDPKKSTIAAANYLSDLYAMFQSWELAAAGYNCGEDRVQAAIDKYQINDFWQISEYTLPRETKNYVPKLMAALIIAKNPGKYGFTAIDYHESEFSETVSVPPQKSLNDIAQVIGVSRAKLVELNPALLAKATPPGSPYAINVPQGYAATTSQKTKELYALKNVDPSITRSTVASRYKVRRGDTLGRIAGRYGVSVSSIKRANGLRSSTIRIGQLLTIPGSGSSRSYASSNNYTSTVKYRVRRGDTLGAIAARHRVSIASIKNANGLRGSLIRSGQVLTIPDASGRYYDTEMDAAGNTKKIAKYRVRPGDTLGGIAARYNVGISTIRHANRINGSTIIAGQELTIPYISTGSAPSGPGSSYAASESTTPSKYTVRPGDTLGGIARRYGVSVASIRSANNIRGSVIKRGQVLTIPGSYPAAASSSPGGGARQSGSSKYTVRRGDTLGGIARRYGVSVASIRSANNIRGSVIKHGQVLTIPGASASPSAGYASSNGHVGSNGGSTYKVRRGDTLGAIANKHGVQLASLKSANNLNGNIIRAGQKLVIPNGHSSYAQNGSNDIIKYNVKKGDTLWEIASKHNVSVASIKKWNNLKSANLAPGDKLTIYK